MDETTFRILDALSRDFGRPASINGLVGKIRELGDSAYYKNIYEKVQDLGKEGVVRIERVGRNSQVRLDFGIYQLMDLLTEMELMKKRRALEEARRLNGILPGVEGMLRRFEGIKSASMINPSKTLSLNRLEILIIFREGSMKEDLGKEMLQAHGAINEMQDKMNIRMDMLPLGENEFLGLLEAEDYNPLREMVSSQIAFLYPQNFWSLAGKAAKGAISQERGIIAGKISENDMTYNMERFGYREMGTEAVKGTRICLECTAISMLMSRNARRIGAVPILLAKNTPNYNLLIFLSRKYGAEGNDKGSA
jgi:hypothetical protein